MNFLKKIFSPSLLVISLLVLIYVFYRSEIYWKGDIRIYYYKYYLISLILIFFSVCSFFINEKIKEYLVIFGFTFITSFYAMEIYLNFKKTFPEDQLAKEKIYKELTGKNWDRRSKLKIFKDLKKINNNVSMAVYPSYFIEKNYSIFPLSGISNSETIVCNENGYFSIYKSDRYGFNNPDKEWDSKKIEYLIAGDSFAHGFCVNRPNDIGSILRNLSQKPVINLGYGGSGPLMQYATLREYLNVNVKKVLWIYYEGNDLSNLEKEIEDKILINYLEDKTFNQNLKSRQNEINTLVKKLLDKKEISFDLVKIIKFYNLRKLLNLAKDPPPEFEPTPPKQFKKILKLAKDLTEKNNSKLYFVYLPEYNRYKTKYDDTNYNLIKNIITKLGIPFIDIHDEIFKKEKSPTRLFPFKSYGHFNKEGYKKVSTTIYKLTLK